MSAETLVLPEAWSVMAMCNHTAVWGAMLDAT